MPESAEMIEVDGHEVRIANPDKVFFPDGGITKMDLVRYYLAVGEGALRGCYQRPVIMHRFPNGVAADSFYQKRLSDHRPEWIESVTVSFPSGRKATMIAPQDVAHIVWAVNLGCIDINPWPVRSSDVDHPDELRVDLDPTPGIAYDDVWRTALIVKDVLAEHELTGFPKTSGKRGMHIYVRIEQRWSFTEVRRAALALAREVERRAGGMATTAWWKEERHGVFVDYNQNARDRSIASVYSVRPLPDARVSTPLTWDEVEGVDPAAFTIATVPDRFAAGDPHTDIDRRAASLEPLLDLARRDEAGGLGDAPWPPHFPKADREPRRVAPSRRKRDRPIS